MILTFATTVLAATIALKPEASVRGTEVTLGEIAVVSGVSNEEAARLAAVRLGGAPAPGWTRRFDRGQIEAAIKLELPGVTHQVTGADACRTSPTTRVIEATQIQTLAEEALRQRFTGLDCEIRANAQTKPLVVPEPDQASAFELKVSLDERAPSSGAWSVGVQVWLDGELYRTAFATFEISTYERHSVLVKPVRRGEVVPHDAFVYQRAKVIGASASKTLAADQAIGATALRDLAPGAVLTNGDVQRERLVRRGDVITVEVAKGAVVARSTMVAQDDGALGDRVKVVSNDKKKSFVAAVTGRGSVRVQL